MALIRLDKYVEFKSKKVRFVNRWHVFTPEAFWFTAITYRGKIGFITNKKISKFV